MAFDGLSEFIGVLESEGELARVSAEVDCAFEIAEITRRVCGGSGGGPALLFDRIHHSTVPVVTNLLGSERRLCLALNVDSLDDVAARIAAALRPDLPDGWLDALRFVPQLARLTNLPPKVIETGTSQQVVRIGTDVNLHELPVPHCWPAESAPALTAGQVITLDPETGSRQSGVYPLEVRNHNSLRVHWTVHDDMSEVLAAYAGRKLQMPLVVALGGDPLLFWSAAAPVPRETDSLLLAGFLRGKNVELVKCRSIDGLAPAGAEFNLEGYIDTAAPPEPGGPLAASAGHYGSIDPLPVMHVTAITHRSNPLLPAIIPGPIPSEPSHLLVSFARAFLPFVRLFIPEIIDIHLPAFGGSRNMVFVSIRKRFPGQARKVINAVWSLGPLMTAKLVVVVDDDVNVRDERAVWQSVGCSVHPGRDTIFSEGPAHMDDHAAPVRGMGHRMGIDATRKRADEGHTRDWPEPLRSTAQIEARVTERWAEYGLAESLNSCTTGRTPDDGR